MARRLIPLLDRVLIETVIAPTKSAGGVLLPESAVPKVGLVALQQRCPPQQHCWVGLLCTVGLSCYALNQLEVARVTQTWP